MGKFIDYIEQTGRKVGRSQAFSDFLTFAVCALSMQTQEELYLRTAKAYTKDEMQNFANAFGQLVIDMDDNGNGLKDCLGDYFMECSSSKTAGQFFTSPEVCDLMVQLTQPNPFTEINDPCCGSGRFFLSVAKLEKHNIYYGADISYQCCQMTLINLCLNNLMGYVSHMNTLSLEEWHRWEVRPHPVHLCPYIREIPLKSKESTLSDLAIEKIVEAKPPQIQQATPIKDEQLSLLFNQIDILL